MAMVTKRYPNSLEFDHPTKAIMSSFTGLYVQRDSTGVICDVHVIDAAGNQNSLDPEVYLQSGTQPPIDQLPDFGENFVAPYRVVKERTLISVVGWATIAAAIVALIAATLSIQYDCYGVPQNSEQCLWARSLFLVTSGIFLFIAWPICFVVGLALWWWRDLDR